MSDTLYRKYRPKHFDDLTGQDHIKITLLNQVESGKIAHAYLFTGPRGVGKTTTARLLSAAVNCPDFKDCDSILDGHDLDVIEIDAASNSGVENVRENIIENSRFTPNKRKYKVFIIDEVHMLSMPAFNALLKILEEPPAHAIFILATTELHKVPVTIVSRCQRYDFKKITASDMINRLQKIAKAEKVRVDDDVLAEIARHSEGCLRDAESLLGQIFALGDETITMERARIVIPASNMVSVLELIELLADKNSEKGVLLINSLVDQGVDMNRFTIELLEMLRILLISKISVGLQSIASVSSDVQKDVVMLTEKFSKSEIIRLIDLFAKKRLEIKTAILAQLPLELAIVEFTSILDSQSIGTQASVTNSVEQNIDEKKTINVKESSQSVDELNLDKVNESMNSKNIINKKKLSNQEATITVEAVKEKWTEFLTALQGCSPSLVLILKTAEPLEIKGDKLIIGYKYPFHQDRMASGDNSEVLEKIFSEVYNQCIVVQHSVLPSDYKSDFITQTTQQDEVELLADTFVAENTSSLALSDKGSEVTIESQSQDELIQNLVQAFGGKVVE